MIASTFSLCLVASLMSVEPKEITLMDGSTQKVHVQIVHKCAKTAPVEEDQGMIFQERYDKK